MLDRIEKWIVQTNRAYQRQRYSCSMLAPEFEGFYPLEFLDNAYFVVVKKIPKPNWPELRHIGLGDFIDMQADAMTYMDTYYMSERHANNLQIHFHELVHVAQWELLGAVRFISRYIAELQQHGYAGAPLEQMAYGLDGHYASGSGKFDVPQYVQSNL